MKSSAGGVTLFDGAGDLVNVDLTYTDPENIPGGATRGFEEIFSDHHSGVARVRYQVQAQRP